MPANPSNIGEAIAVFMRILGLSKESLKKIILRGEFDEYTDDKHMHCTARLAELFEKYSYEVQKSGENNSSINFLFEEIYVLEEAKGVGLPNFLPRSAFLILLQGKVSGISGIPVKFVDELWNYVETVVVAVLMKHCGSYLQVHSFLRRAGQNMISKMKEKSKDRVMEIVEMEKFTDYTCDPEYLKTWTELMAQKNVFEGAINDPNFIGKIKIEGFGEVEVGHLRKYDSNIREQAFDMKMRITAYWKIVLKRLVDSVALHVLLSLQRLVNNEMEMEFVSELMGAQGGGLEWMLEETPATATKRERLKRRVMLLKDSKEVVAKIMDRVSFEAD
ncbi:hypothetical protein LguiA_024592 [Lonicera macranthoides]